MLSIWSMPLNGVCESCIELTEPFDVTVVVMPHMADAAEPMRISLPSIEPRSCAIPISSILGLPPISCGTETKIPAVKAKSITPKIQAASLRRRM